MAPKLSDFTTVRLGYKSLLNDFFYVNKQTIDQFGIEDEYLVPIFRLRDLDGGTYYQDVQPEMWVFRCKVEPPDLRGTGASRYIEWGRIQTTKPRKQSSKPVKLPEAPALQDQKHWYWPAAPTHLTQIAVRKGVGEVYAPFLFREPALVDQRCYLIRPTGVPGALVSAYLSSALFSLALETHADLGLGAGVLTLGTLSLRSLPAIDLTRLSTAHKEEILEAFHALTTTSPPTASSYYANEAQRRLDAAFLEAAGVSATRLEELHDSVRLLWSGRNKKASRRASIRAVGERTNIEAVIDNIAAALDTWLQVRRFPEGYGTSNEGPLLRFTDHTLEVTMRPFMGPYMVHIESDNGVEYYDQLDPGQAEVLLRALQMGRRNVTLPATEADCQKVLKGFDAFLSEFEGILIDKFNEVGLGERHRNRVYGGVLRKLNMPLEALRTPFEGGSFIL